MSFFENPSGVNLKQFLKQNDQATPGKGFYSYESRLSFISGKRKSLKDVLKY